MNKNGIFFIDDIIGIFAIVFIMLIFLLAFGFLNFRQAITGGPSEEVITAMELSEEKEYSYALLEMPAKISGQDVTIADIISYAVYNEDYSALDEVLAKTFQDTSYYWSIVLADRDNPDVFYYSAVRKGWHSVDLREPLQEVMIPKYKGNGMILLKIKIGEGTAVTNEEKGYSVAKITRPQL